MRRYFAAHPVSYVATTMFFIGMATLIAKLINVVAQYHSLDSISLGEPGPGGNGLNHCQQLLSQLQQLPQRTRESYLGMRLSNILELIRRKGTADGLDEDLKYLSDLDQGRQQEGYAFARIIIWATPMLGFLGTVIGITQALGNLDPVELANSIQTAMQKLLDGLYVAFDTTALALSLSIVLMFVQFLIDQIESQLLSKVDDRTNKELLGRFPQWGTQTDPYVASVQKMCQEVMHTSEQLVAQQTTLWKNTVDSAHQQWSQLGQASLTQAEQALSTALNGSLQQHAHTLAEQSETAANSATQRWNQAQDHLLEQLALLLNQQRELAAEHSADANRWQGHSFRKCHGGPTANRSNSTNTVSFWHGQSMPARTSASWKPRSMTTCVHCPVHSISKPRSTAWQQLSICSILDSAVFQRPTRRWNWIQPTARIALHETTSLPQTGNTCSVVSVSGRTSLHHGCADRLARSRRPASACTGRRNSSFRAAG